eukprot:3970878-Prymnesium_polylepis.1
MRRRGLDARTLSYLTLSIYTHSHLFAYKRILSHTVHGGKQARSRLIAARPPLAWPLAVAANTTSDHPRGNPRISVPSARTVAAPASRVRPTSHPA